MTSIQNLDTAGKAMWALVERYTGHVGYKGGVKAADGLKRNPPVVDCSGWTALLLAEGMAAANGEAAYPLFNEADLAAVHTWSDQMIENLEHRSGFVLTGDQITADALPYYATIGLQQGEAHGPRTILDRVG